MEFLGFSCFFFFLGGEGGISQGFLESFKLFFPRRVF